MGLAGGVRGELRTSEVCGGASRAPTLLVLHLKRFARTPRGGIQKINVHVPFPFDLDVSKYVDPKVWLDNLRVVTRWHPQPCLQPFLSAVIGSTCQSKG